MFTLFRRYWDDLVSYEGGLTLVMIDALLLVPLIMAAFFYPFEVLVAVAAVLVASVAAYEGYLIWRKRRPQIKA